MIERIDGIHANSTSVYFKCGSPTIIGNGEFRALSGRIDGFILYADSSHFENGQKLSTMELKELRSSYQEYILNREDFIDWASSDGILK